MTGGRTHSRRGATLVLGALITLGIGAVILSSPQSPDPMLRYSDSETPTENLRALQLYQSARNCEWNHPDQPDIVIEQYERAVAESSIPADSEIHWRLGAVYRRQGSWNDALAEFERAIDLHAAGRRLVADCARRDLHAPSRVRSGRAPARDHSRPRPERVQTLFWEIQIPLFRDGDVTGLVAAIHC